MNRRITFILRGAYVAWRTRTAVAHHARLLAADQDNRLTAILNRPWRDEFGHLHCPTCGGIITTAVPWASVRDTCTCLLTAVTA